MYENISLLVKKVKACKLQLDTLGYIYATNGIAGREYYKAHLRSGKTPIKRGHTGSRDYQYNEFLKRYFNLEYQHIKIDRIPSYVAVIAYCSGYQFNKYQKPTVKVAKKLLKLDYIQVVTLVTGDKIIKDTFNNVVYHAYDNKLYLLRKNSYINVKYL